METNGLIPDAIQLAKSIIKKYEGLYSKTPGKYVAFNTLLPIADNTPVYAYIDSGGVPTIGYGTIRYKNGQSVKANDVITYKQCLEEFDYEFTEKWNAIQIANKILLTSGQTAALVSLSYNIGINALKSSTLWFLLQSGKPATEVAKQFDVWVLDNGKRVQGLVNRRASEKKIFLT